jgi:two-component sensor histidine kinase
MDPRSLATLMLISGVECSLLFFVASLGGRRAPPFGPMGSAARIQPSRARPTLYWAAGTAVYVLGMFGLLLQGSVAPWLGVLVPNMLLVLGQLLILAGIRRLTGARGAWLRYGLALAAYGILAAAFTYGFRSTQARIVLFSVAIASFYIEGAVLAFARRPKSGGGFHVFLSSVFIGLSAFFLLRAGFTIVRPPDSIFSAGALNIATYIVSHVGLIGWSLGLILMQQRATEAALEESAAEKALLLRELQHRVKNSLSVVASLVGLEASRAEGAELTGTFDALHDRVSAMAMLYDQLFEAGDSESADLDRYLGSIAEALFHGQGAGERGVKLRLDLEPLTVDARRAGPLGLIVNELASDCLKHAFPDGRGGTVAVSLSVAAGEATLCVRDDGIGLPPGFTPGTSCGTGLRLVALLAEQAGGSFSAGSDGGAVFTVRFPVAGYQER